jgi:3-phosphoshikimate 1-carboxyvinyltransferase
LDADIQYEKKEGYLPLLIKGKKLMGGKLKLDVSKSSQFLTALLLISPKLGELKITFSSTPVSFPYVEMTMDILRNFDVKIESSKNGITIDTRKLCYKSVKVENDWSAAAFWYSCVALSEDQNICLLLNGLQKNSLQGDDKSIEYFKLLGVETTFTNQGIEIKKNSRVSEAIKLNLIHQPDLAQSLIVTAAALGIKGEFTGLQSLKLKETDRMEALVTELKEMNILISSNKKDTIILSGGKTIKKGKRAIQTYQDHRMAMAFSPLSLILNNIKIENPEIVKKSYPKFWSEIKKFIDIKVV